MGKRQIFLIAIMLLFTTSIMANNLIDEIEGVYVIPGKATYQRCRDCAWEPVKNATDCLVIKKITNKTVSIFMSTIQARGHSCTIEEDYIFTVNGENELFFQDKDMPLEKKSDGIYVIKNRDSIRFSIQPQKIRRCIWDAVVRLVQRL